MSKYKANIITCQREDCFGYYKGVCSILIDTDFGKRECPFFKPKETVKTNEGKKSS